MLSDVLKIHVCLFVCLFVSSLKRNRNRTEDAQKLLEKRMSALNDSLQTLSQEVRLALPQLSWLTLRTHNSSLEGATELKFVPFCFS